MTLPVRPVSQDELFAVVDERRDAASAFITWAEHREASNQSMYLANRADIADAREVASVLFPDAEWWGILKGA